jgi:transcriptional regulator with XRE-family HTH domain
LRGLGVTVSTAFIEPSVHVVTAAGLSIVPAPTKVALRLARACVHASEVFDVIASHGNSFHPASGKPCARVAQCRLSAAAGSPSAKPSRRCLIQKPPAWGLVHGQQVGVAQLRVLPQLEQHGAQGRRLARRWRPQRAYPLQRPTRARLAAPVQARDAAEVRHGDAGQQVQQRVVPGHQRGLRQLLAVVGDVVDEEVPGPLQRERDGGPVALAWGDLGGVKVLDEAGGGDEHGWAPEAAAILPQSTRYKAFEANTFLVSALAPDTPPFLAPLAANLIALRAKGNWSIAALAEQARVNSRMIRLVEQGQVNVSLNTVDKLARALGVTTGSLVGVKPVARQEGDALIEEVLARNLVSARKGLKLTQDTLGQRSGVSMFVIAHIERQARNPSLHTLARLAGALDLSLEALLSQ